MTFTPQVAIAWLKEAAHYFTNRGTKGEDKAFWANVTNAENCHNVIALLTPKHVLYETGDADAPEAIKDRNGAVVLGMCKICEKAEIELDQPCIPKDAAAEAKAFCEWAYRDHGLDWSNAVENELAARFARRDAPNAEAPGIPGRIPCPECHALHVDEPPYDKKPHHTHACQNCGAVFRPFLVNTIGVRFLPGFKNEEPLPF